MQEKRISGCRGGVGGADEAVSIETNYWRDRKERSAGSEMRREREEQSAALLRASTSMDDEDHTGEVKSEGKQ